MPYHRSFTIHILLIISTSSIIFSLSLFLYSFVSYWFCFFFFQAEDGIRDYKVTGVQTCALLIFTPHICTEQLLPLLRIPLIDMVSVVAEETRAHGLKRVALLGTRSTVESKMFGRLGEIGRASCRERV